MLYFHLDQYMWVLTTRTLDSGPTKFNEYVLFEWPHKLHN